MNQTDEEIKKEYKQFIGTRCLTHPDFFPDECCGNADWWLSKLHTLQEEYKKELIEKMYKIDIFEPEEFDSAGDDDYANRRIAVDNSRRWGQSEMKEKIINIIKQ